MPPQPSSVSVLTASIPSRADLLAECEASVAEQTVPVLEHLVMVDHDRRGESFVTNRLCERAKGDWVITLNDDDLLHPRYVERVLAASDGADLVWTDYEVTGSDWYCDPRHEPAELRTGNFIPTTVLVKRDWLLAFPLDESLSHCEDWDFYRRIMEAGAVFKFVDEKLWTYRFGVDETHKNKSRS